MMFWPGPGGLRDEPPEGDCDGECDCCANRECDERGAECADPDNCKDCPANGRCESAINDNEENEE